MIEMQPHTDPFVDLTTELVRINGRLKSIFGTDDLTGGLSTMEAMVLAAVVQADRPPTVPQIGRSFGHARQVIQRSVNALIAAGLVVAAPNPDHKRASLLLATAKGLNAKRDTDLRVSQASKVMALKIDAEKCRHLANEIRLLRCEIESYIRSEKSKIMASEPSLSKLSAEP